MYWIIIIASLIASWYVGYVLKKKFSEYSQVAFRGGLTGAEVAQKMLRDNGIADVKVQSVEGKLTDHYNPADKTVNLSPEVFHGRSVAAAAIAAHECGHAVQHARAYAWLGMRSKLVPTVSFAARWTQWIIMGGVFLAMLTPMLGFGVIALGVALFAITTLFAFITLPVEFDASKRALLWLDTSGIVAAHEHDMAKDALKWAGMTYLVAALSSLAMLLYYVSIFFGGRRNS